MPKRNKVAGFDLGNTVVLYDWSIALSAFVRHGIEPARIAGTLVHGDLYEGLEGDLYRGKLTPREFYRVFLALNQKRTIDGAIERPDISERRFWDIMNSIFMPNPPMERLIRKLKRRSYTLLLITNIAKPQLDYIQSAFRILDEFDLIVPSYKAGISKPSPGIYQYACRKIGGAPDFYADDLGWNLDYPRSVGAKTFLYRPDYPGEFEEWLESERIL